MCALTLADYSEVGINVGDSEGAAHATSVSMPLAGVGAAELVDIVCCCWGCSLPPCMKTKTTCWNLSNHNKPIHPLTHDSILNTHIFKNLFLVHVSFLIHTCSFEPMLQVNIPFPRQLTNLWEACRWFQAKRAQYTQPVLLIEYAFHAKCVTRVCDIFLCSVGLTVALLIWLLSVSCQPPTACKSLEILGMNKGKVRFWYELSFRDIAVVTRVRTRKSAWKLLEGGRIIASALCFSNGRLAIWITKTNLVVHSGATRYKHRERMFEVVDSVCTAGQRNELTPSRPLRSLCLAFAESCTPICRQRKNIMDTRWRIFWVHWTRDEHLNVHTTYHMWFETRWVYKSDADENTMVPNVRRTVIFGSTKRCGNELCPCMRTEQHMRIRWLWRLTHHFVIKTLLGPCFAKKGFWTHYIDLAVSSIQRHALLFLTYHQRSRVQSSQIPCIPQDTWLWSIYP